MDDRPHAAQDPPSSTESRSKGSKGLGPITGTLLVLLTLAIVTLAFLSWRRALSTADRSVIAPGPLPSTDAAQPPPPTTPPPPRAAPGPPPPKTAADLIEEAKRFADGVVESFPNDPDAIEVKARVRHYLGDSSTAVECWQRCLELNPDYAYAYHGLGLVAAKKADDEEAAALQRKAWTLAPGFADAAVALAEALMKLGKIEETIEVLEEHVRLDPASMLSHVVLGQAYMQAREHEKARDAFRAALELYPDVSNARYGLATALARLGQSEESKREMEKAKELRAEKKIRAGMGSRFDDLEAMCVDFAVNYTSASRVYLAHREAAAAERLCRRAATLDPQNTQCRILLATLFQQTNRGEDALAMCRQLVEIQPESAAFYLNLGTMCGNLGRLDEAEKAFREVVRLAPNQSEGHAALARLYLRGTEKRAQAVELAQEALRTDPSAANHFLLAETHAGNGNRDAALAALRKAIDLDPDNPQYQEVLKLLQPSK
jgi:tetratricopeptide (TPR) repeat protein